MDRGGGRRGPLGQLQADAHDLARSGSSNGVSGGAATAAADAPASTRDRAAQYASAGQRRVREAPRARNRAPDRHSAEHTGGLGTFCTVARLRKLWSRSRSTAIERRRRNGLRTHAWSVECAADTQAAVRPRIARRRRALRGRPVGPGAVPGPEHEPAPRGPPQRRPRVHASRRQHRLLPPRRHARPRGVPTDPGRSPAEGHRWAPERRKEPAMADIKARPTRRSSRS